MVSREHGVVGENLGLLFMFLPELLPDQHLGVAAGEKVLNGFPLRSIGKFDIQNHAGMVLAQFLFLRLVIRYGQRSQKARLEKLVVRAIHSVENFIEFDQNSAEVIGLAVNVFAGDEERPTITSIIRRRNTVLNA